MLVSNTTTMFSLSTFAQTPVVGAPQVPDPLPVCPMQPPHAGRGQPSTAHKKIAELRLATARDFTFDASAAADTSADSTLKGKIVLVGDTDHYSPKVGHDIYNVVSQFFTPGDKFLVETVDDELPSHPWICAAIEMHDSTLASCVGIEDRDISRATEIAFASHETALRQLVKFLHAKSPGNVPFNPDTARMFELRAFRMQVHQRADTVALTDTERQQYSVLMNRFIQSDQHAATTLESNMPTRDAHFAQEIRRLSDPEHATFVEIGAAHTDELRKQLGTTHDVIVINHR